MKTKADLYRKYADMIDMCEGTKVEPVECVKHDLYICCTQPKFNRPAWEYEFAHCIVEDKAVFTGDELYYKGEKVNIRGRGDFHIPSLECNILSCNTINYVSNLSWVKPEPKKMIELHGSIPMPDGDSSGYELQSRRVFYKNSADRDEASRILISLMGGE